MRLHTLAFIVSLLFVVVLDGCRRAERTTVRIAVASNMQVVMPPLVDAFTARTGVACDVIISSSGKLTTQIKEGAPIDIFVSADQFYPAQLHAWGLSAEVPVTYAFGTLVLWSKDENVDDAVQALARSQSIALPNPEMAPYGKAAQQWLNRYFQGSKSSQLVFGESVAQVNQFLSSGAVDAAFTAMSTTQIPKLQRHGTFHTIDTSSYDAIAQDVVLLKSGVAEARLFYDFLLSNEARNIMATFGYHWHE